MQIEKSKWITYSLTDCLVRFAKRNKKFVVLDADLSDDLGLKKFSDLYPKRFVQNGIAEQDMVSMAGGIALNGILPIVNSFASFLTSRANEQIYNNDESVNVWEQYSNPINGKSYSGGNDLSFLFTLSRIYLRSELGPKTKYKN